MSFDPTQDGIRWTSSLLRRVYALRGMTKFKKLKQEAIIQRLEEKQKEGLKKLAVLEGLEPEAAAARQRLQQAWLQKTVPINPKDMI